VTPFNRCFHRGAAAAHRPKAPSTCTQAALSVGSVREERPEGAMATLNGREAGNGGYSQGEPKAHRGLLYSERGDVTPAWCYAGSMRTVRLVLRRWHNSDRLPFARLNADAQVMEFLPSILSEQESNSLVDRIEAHFQEHGFGLYAAEIRSDRRFIGFIGLSVPTFPMPHSLRAWRSGGDWPGSTGAGGLRRKVLRKLFATHSRTCSWESWSPSRYRPMPAR